VTIRIERHAAQAFSRLTLERATKGNSLSAAMVADLAAALDTCHRDGTRVLLIDAAGANFCTGFDLSALDVEDDDSLLARFVRVEVLLQRVHRAPFLTIAVAQGKAWGAGADLFAACSQRWVCDDASLAFPGAAFGLVLGTGRLAARVGSSQAEEWVACGTRIDAPTALATGLATRRVPGAADTGVAAALEFAESSRRVDPVTLAALRNAAAARGHADDAVDLARLVRSAARPGLRERIQAYRAASARRPPASRD
jgi:enoyl-CoA hydratase/carnithine racemase